MDDAELTIWGIRIGAAIGFIVSFLTALSTAATLAVEGTNPVWLGIGIVGCIIAIIVLLLTRS
jgi:multidrug transporter EmrE-like cation transporter